MCNSAFHLLEKVKRYCSKRLIPFVFLLYLCFPLSLFSFAATDIKSTINYQGKVVNSDGTNVIAGIPSCVAVGADTCDFRFSIYDALTGGNLLWTENQTDIEIGDYDGIFNVKLGRVTSFSAALRDFGRDDLYIEVEFDPSGNADFAEGEIFSPSQNF